MKRILTILTGTLLALDVSAQVNSYVSSRYGIVNQLETYGRVSYQGLNYFPTGTDSLLVKNDVCKSDSIIFLSSLSIDNKPYVVSGFRDMAFEFDTDLKYIEIPSTFTEVSNSCFYQCSNLRGCMMPDIKVIQGFAFFRTGFQNLTLHEGLEYIGASAFQECSKLESVELPSTLEYIGDNAFLGCEQLTTVKVNFDKPIELGSNVFWLYRPNRPRKHKTLMVPAGSKPAFEAHEQWRLFQTIVEH